MNIDKIIERILAEEDKIKQDELEVETTRQIREFYRCDADGYDIMFDPVNCTAKYRFDQKEGALDVAITLAQRTYYIESDYWRLVAKAKNTPTE